MGKSNKKSTKKVDVTDDASSDIEILDSSSDEDITPIKNKRGKKGVKFDKPVGSADDYKKLGEIEHIRQAPDMFVGSAIPEERTEWVMNRKMKFVERKVDTIPAMCSIFLEIFANAIDNSNRTRIKGYNPGNIDVTFDKKTITIRNEGLPIPITINKKENMYTPFMIFGTLRTSSNYKKNRTEIGRNGYGGKLTNIFSKSFEVSCVDSSRNLKFYQKWVNAMQPVGEPLVEETDQEISEVVIKYEMDWDFFEVKPGLTEEFCSIALRYCADMSLSARIPVNVKCNVGKYVFKKKFDYSNINDYAALYFGNVHNHILYYRWPKGTQIKKRADGTEYPAKGHVLPEIELYIADTPNCGKHVSFVNSLNSPEHGVHLDAAVSASTKEILSGINDDKSEKKTPAKKTPAKKAPAKKDEKKTKAAPKLTIKDVKDNVSIIMLYRVENPVYASQSKTKLKGPPVKIEIPRGLLDKVKTWELVNCLKALMYAKTNRMLKSTDGKLRGRNLSSKIEDANWAGKKRASECVLMFVEGDSARNLAVILTGVYPNGRDSVGILTSRGKFRNAVRATPLEVANSREIQDIKNGLGLKEGYDYTDPKMRATLKYGKFMIITDADEDGKHIKGLVLAFFRQYFPSLLEAEFVVDYRTPVVRMYKGKLCKKLYTEREIEEWKAETPDYHKWKPKYFKGLGSCSKAEIIDDFNSAFIVKFISDEFAHFSIDRAFSDKYVNQRKDMIRQKMNYENMPEIKDSLEITDFVTYELRDFWMSCLKRHIPGLDGLNEARRKIIYSAIKNFGVAKGKSYSMKKVADIASETSVTSKYHHGEMLTKVVTGMAYDFVGGNNIPFFSQESSLGTRDGGGKDAAQPRYTVTFPEWWIPYVFMKEDEPLLVHRIDENTKIEPEIYLPLFPIDAVNGASGIAVGFSTLIIPHHPLDVLDFLRALIKGEEPKKIKPYYRGFTGDIRIIDKRNKVKMVKLADGSLVPAESLEKESSEDEDSMIIDNSDEEDDDIIVDDIVIKNDDFIELDDDEKKLEGLDIDKFVEKGDYDDVMFKSVGRYSMVTSGRVKLLKNGNYVIVELPIGLWTRTYREYLKDCISKGILKDYIDRSDDINVYFELIEPKPEFFGKETNSKCYKPINFKLVRSYGMSNIHVLNKDGLPHLYSDMMDLLRGFYEFRLPYYEKRRSIIMKGLEEEMDKINKVIAFIQDVIDGKVVIVRGNGRSRPVKEIHAEMDEYGHDHKLLDAVLSSRYTEEEIEKLQEKAKEKKDQIKAMKKETAGSLWMKDMEAFELEYLKRYDDDREFELQEKIMKGRTKDKRKRENKKNNNGERGNCGIKVGKELFTFTDSEEDEPEEEEDSEVEIIEDSDVEEEVVIEDDNDSSENEFGTVLAEDEEIELADEPVKKSSSKRKKDKKDKKKR